MKVFQLCALLSAAVCIGASPAPLADVVVPTEPTYDNGDAPYTNGGTYSNPQTQDLNTQRQDSNTQRQDSNTQRQDYNTQRQDSNIQRQDDQYGNGDSSRSSTYLASSDIPYEDQLALAQMPSLGSACEAMGLPGRYLLEKQCQGFVTASEKYSNNGANANTDLRCCVVANCKKHEKLNPKGSEGGYGCLNTYKKDSCYGGEGHFVENLCPGDKSVQCCVEKSIPYTA